MLRIKLIAVLLGPSGIGLVGLYISATSLIGTVSGLGIGTSGVREVAEAHGFRDADLMAKTVTTVRRACWVTGIIGWILTIALSYPLSVYTFGSGDHVLAIAILGVTILINSIFSGQNALIQGTQRIGDLARMGVLGAVTGTVVAVCLYTLLGEKGIVPVIIVTAAVNLGFSSWFVRKIPVIAVSLTWKETLGNSKRLIHIGVAFVYGAILCSIVDLAIRSMIVKKLGLDANGIYQAAWAISGMCAGFIINAMGADFYPRLTAVAQDNDQVNRLVNEQTEIGMLLALPGLLGTMVFAPWLMRLFYTSKFLAGAELLPWFVIGAFIQVIIFPMGMIARAKGAVKWIYIGQTWSNTTYLIIAFFSITYMGLRGSAYAYSISIALYTIVVYLIARRLSKFVWERSTFRLSIFSFLLIFASLCVQKFPGNMLPLSLGIILTAIACIASLRGIALRLGRFHRIVKMACLVPCGPFICGITPTHDRSGSNNC